MSDAENTENAENAPKAPVIGPNSLNLPWPQDPMGAMTALRKGGIEAARRVNGDRARMKTLLDTLKVIEAHARAKFLVDTQTRRKAREDAANAGVRFQAARAKQAEARAEALEKQAAELRGAVNG